MQIVPNAAGWQETITVQVDIIRIRERSLLVSDWTRFNKGHPKIAEQRAGCGCCGVKWADTQTVWVNLVYVERGPNRPICDNCLTLIRQTFKGKII